jgi:hypothetical protein
MALDACGNNLGDVVDALYLIVSLANTAVLGLTWSGRCEN